MSDIKLFAGYYVYFQENLSNKDKITFFNFIKEATDNQVECLLLTGKMISEERVLEFYSKDLTTVIDALPHQTSGDVINSLARVLNKHTAQGVAKGQIQGAVVTGGIVIAALAATLAAKLYKSYFSKAARACKGKKGVEKQKCMRNAKMAATKEKIIALAKAQGVCSKSKQPEKCVAKLKLKIAKEKIKMKKIKF